MHVVVNKTMLLLVISIILWCLTFPMKQQSNSVSLISQGKLARSTPIWANHTLAAYGNDGSFTRGYSSKQITSSNQIEYWWLDLEGLYVLDSILIFAKHRNMDYKLYLVNDLPVVERNVQVNYKACDSFRASSSLEAAPSRVIERNPDLFMYRTSNCRGTGRFLIIQGKSTLCDYLYLHEIEVYGSMIGNLCFCSLSSIKVMEYFIRL